MHSWKISVSFRLQFTIQLSFVHGILVIVSIFPDTIALQYKLIVSHSNKAKLIQTVGCVAACDSDNVVGKNL